MAWPSGSVQVGDIVTASQLNLLPIRIADSTASGSVASFDFTSLPGQFAHLLIRVMARGDTAVTGVNCLVRFNNDNGANYSYQYITANNSTNVSALGAVSATSVPVGGFPAASSPASYPGYLDLGVTQYAGTSLYKVGQANSFIANTALNTGMQLGPMGFMWLSTSAINRVTIFPSSGNFVAGSRATIYGLP